MTQNIAPVQIRIDDWVAGLAAIPENKFTLENVQGYIIQHAVAPETLDKYSFFPKEITRATSFSKTISSSV